MHLIKLDAIDSTNDFLKRMSVETGTPNFTVVTAEEQTKGRGQMGAKWSAEKGKNLTMSILVKEVLPDISFLFHLNIMFSLAVIEALEVCKVPALSIKWPNDIMSYQKKIGGILIENSIKSSGEITSIIGLGLNVNQLDFEDLPKASSMALVTENFFDKNVILETIVNLFEQKINNWEANKKQYWDDYTQLLFKIGFPMPFQMYNEEPFMGIIQGVSDIGRLLVMLEDDTVKEFDIKEIQMLY